MITCVQWGKGESFHKTATWSQPGHWCTDPPGGGALPLKRCTGRVSFIFFLVMARFDLAIHHENINKAEISVVDPRQEIRNGQNHYQDARLSTILQKLGSFWEHNLWKYGNLKCQQTKAVLWNAPNIARGNCMYWTHSGSGQVQKKWPPSVTIRLKNKLAQTSFIFILSIADML